MCDRSISSNFSACKGLGKNSLAPASKLLCWSISNTLAEEAIATTSFNPPICRKRRSISNPSITGITKSVIIKSGWNSTAFSKPSAPFFASTNSNPIGSSKFTKIERFSHLSSTTKIFRFWPSKPIIVPCCATLEVSAQFNAKGKSKSKLKMLPFPGSLCTSKLLPIKDTIFWLIAKPNPVPSDCFLLFPTCSNGKNIFSNCSRVIPTPVSSIWKRIFVMGNWELVIGNWLSSFSLPSLRGSAWEWDDPLPITSILNVTPPFSVNFIAFPSKLINTCRRRFSSMQTPMGRLPSLW